MKKKGIWSNCFCIDHTRHIMSAFGKPIQPTPTLSGEDAKKIIKEALSVPTSEAIEKNEKMLQIRKQITKC